MTKEEKIREAYGEHFDKIKCVLDANGWILMTISITREISIEFERQVRVHENNTYGFPTMCVRPKSLQGIENNNGWIKIESEDDLPKEEYELYFVTGSNTNVHQCIYHIGIKEYWLKTFTHYQPIQKPQPPIY